MLRAVAALMVGLVACDDAPAVPATDTSDTSAPPCGTTAPTACDEPAPTYSNDVAAILDRHCLVCHDGRGDEWPLTDIGHVKDWRDTIRGAMLDCAMPPREEPTTITTDERMTILRWIRCGMPQ